MDGAQEYRSAWVRFREQLKARARPDTPAAHSVDQRHIARVVNDGLCMQCGTCAGLCPEEAISMVWSLDGWLPSVEDGLCTDCGVCLRVCPGGGFDFAPNAWWHERGTSAPKDFVGPVRAHWFAWAADAGIRRPAASGGTATAILLGAMERGDIDHALVVHMRDGDPLVGDVYVARSANEIREAQGATYTAAPVNVALRVVRKEPGRYALMGLPCHVQGLRLAQQQSRTIRERVVLTVGLFCGWMNEPRATWVGACRAGLDPRTLASVRYRAHGEWPGAVRMESHSGMARELSYRQFIFPYGEVFAPPRCRVCPDALNEVADLAMGDTDFDRTNPSRHVVSKARCEGNPAVWRDDRSSHLIVRTRKGEALVEGLRARWLELAAATEDDVLATQEHTRFCKRNVLRGRWWLRGMAGRPLPGYPGVRTRPSWRDRAFGTKSLVEERLLRAWAQVAYRPSAAPRQSEIGQEVE